MKTAFWITIPTLLLFYVLWVVSDEPTPYSCWVRYGNLMIPCEEESSIYNECIWEEGEALERCISDKEYEQKVLKNYK